MIPIVLTASSEEALKLLIVIILSGTRFRIAGLFPFALFEAFFDWSSVYIHLQEFEVEETHITALTAIVLCGLKFLHVATSYIYLFARHRLFALTYCIIWHASWNMMVDAMPTLNFYDYVLLAISVPLLDLAIVALYFGLERIARILASTN